MKDKIIVFGAGATGRAHVGLLAWQAGFEIVFVDRGAALVEALTRAGRYHVTLVDERQQQQIQVDGFRIHHSEQRESIAQEMADAALVLTAVFDQNLVDVARTIALSVQHCRTAGRQRPLNFVACENMSDSSSTLGGHVRALLQGEDSEYADQFFGFPDCMISRVVPRPADNPLKIIAEDYNEWTARAEAFKGPKPEALTALELVDNQSARLERKFFVHNGGHAICGFIGFHRGHEFIHEAVADKVVAEHVVQALDELGEVVRIKHGFSAESIDAYKKDLARRGAVAAMKDSILRVTREPMRKLRSSDRLVAPAKQAVKYGLPRKWIVKGIVAALKYYHRDDEESVLLRNMLERDGLENTVEKICSVGREETLMGEIRSVWDSWAL